VNPAFINTTAGLSAAAARRAIAVSAMSGYAGYEKKTDSTIPVVRLVQAGRQPSAVFGL
jgi:hypothetical protein